MVLWYRLSADVQVLVYRGSAGTVEQTVHGCLRTDLLRYGGTVVQTLCGCLSTGVLRYNETESVDV